MAANYSTRLANLKSRRLGLDRPVTFREGVGLEAYASSQPLRKSFEAYESRGQTDTVRYALGAMQEVDPEYTKNSYEEGDRVKDALQSGLTAADIEATFDYQGSVPLNVHIRGVSDIDLLVLDDRILTYDQNGLRSARGGYTPVSRSVTSYMTELRRECESILVRRYYAAEVDTSGAKAINVSGGSLRRKVDVVPSHWHDTIAYQESGQKYDRNIKVLDKYTLETIPNSPFLHMKRINDKDALSQGGAKKVIRFLKNLKNDSDREIALSSYDIASLVWHFDTLALTQPNYRELVLVAVAQQHLAQFARNRSSTEALWTPDSSRRIIDEPGKFDALVRLAAEVDAIAAVIAGEVSPYLPLTPDRIQKNLKELAVW